MGSSGLRCQEGEQEEMFFKLKEQKDLSLGSGYKSRSSTLTQSSPCRPACAPHLLCLLPPEWGQVLGPMELVQLNSVHVQPFLVGGHRQCQSWGDGSRVVFPKGLSSLSHWGPSLHPGNWANVLAPIWQNIPSPWALAPNLPQGFLGRGKGRGEVKKRREKEQRRKGGPHISGKK